MRKLLVALGTLVAFFALSHCAGAKSYTMDTLPAERITFRYGGGFTGQYQEYMLLPNGQLFYKREVINAVPFREVTAVDPKTAKSFFTTYEKQNFAQMTYDDPGNMTYTIERVSGADSTHMTWGGDNEKPIEEVRSYWRRAMQVFEGKTE